MQEEPLEDPASPARGSFFGSVNIVMATYALDGALAFATGLLVARALGPEGRGAWGLFIVTAALAQVVLGLGAGNAAIYFLNRGELSLRSIVTALQSIVLFAAAAMALAIGGFVLARGGGDVAGGVSPWWFVLAVPLLLELALLRLVMQGLQRWVDLGVATVGHQALILAAVAALYAADAATVERVIAAWLGGSVVASAFVMARIGVRNIDVARVLRPRFDVLRRLTGFGIQGEAGNILQAMNYRLDQYIVRGFTGLSAVGVYAVGVSLTEGVWLIANAVALVLMPRLTSDPEEAEWLAPLACRNTLMIAAAASLALAVVAPVLVPLAFGDAYEDAVQALWLLLPGTVALTGSKVLTSYIFSRGKPLVNTGITAASLVVTLVADLALVPAFGINGAAAAASLAYATHFAVALYAYGRISGQSPLDALVPKRSDVDLYVNLARSTLGRITGRPAASGA